MLRGVIMGVAGSGKSSVGTALAEHVGAAYIDGDDLHPKANVEKMSAGIALTDTDRAPWLVSVGEVLSVAPGPILIGCSALKKCYRDTIRDSAGGPVFFLHLTGARAVIENRMSRRERHFMPLSLINSQFAALEPLEQDELGTAVDIYQPLAAVVAAAADALKGEM